MGQAGVMTRREAVAGVLGALGAGMAMPAAAKPRRAALGSRGMSLSSTGDCKWKQLLKQTVEHTWTGEEDLDWDFLESIGYYAFYRCEFRNIILPNVVTLGERCFYNGRATGNIISMPKLLTAPYPHGFGQCLFYGGTISMPRLKEVGEMMFYQSINRSNNLVHPTTVNVDVATTIKGGAFYNASGLVRLYAPCVTSIASGALLNVSRRYCGPDRNVAADECALVVGSAERGTGLSMDGLMALAGFPCGCAQSVYSPTWYCNDGTVTYDTASASWVKNPF